jgi:hypothetical protein
VNRYNENTFILTSKGKVLALDNILDDEKILNAGIIVAPACPPRSESLRVSRGLSSLSSTLSQSLLSLSAAHW